MATTPLVPEAEETIETGGLITAETGAGIATGDLLVAKSIVGLEPLGEIVGE